MVYISLNKLKPKTEVVDINNNESKTISASKNISKYILNFRGISNPSELSASKDGRNLVITKDRTRVVVVDYFSANGKSTSSKVNTIRYSDNGVSKDVAILDALTISSDWLSFAPNKKGVVSGTVFSDTINMKNNLIAPLNSKNKGLTIKSGRGNDNITGTSFNDTITGGSGTNTYNYDFGAVSGSDIIKLTKGENLILNLKDGNTVLSPADIKFGKSGKDLILYKVLDSENQITIKKFFSTSATVSIGSTKISDYVSSDDFDGFSIVGKGKFSGTQYNDIIIGSSGNDTITAGGGNDDIYTKGGKDTIVETGAYGHDTIYSAGSSKVTVKLSSFNAQNLTCGDSDLVYKTDDNSSFTYKDFVSGNSADLWIKSGKKSYHVSQDNSSVVNYSKHKDNNVIYLTGENQEYIGSSKGVNVIYSLDGENKYTISGNNTIIDYEDNNDSYTATILKSAKLVIDDKGGVDSLTLTNNVKDLVLYFNIDKDETLSDATDLVIYNKSAMTYSNITSAVKSESYTGALDIKNYFSEGNIETIDIKDTVFDIEGWKYFVTSEVSEFLKDYCSGLNTVQDVLEKGTKKQKTALISVFKNSNYQTYLKVVDESLPLSRTKFVKNGDDLNVIITLDIKEGDEITQKDSITTVKDFFKDGAYNDNLGYYALDENGALRKYVIGSTDLPIYINGNEEIAQGTDYSDYVLVEDAKTVNLQKGDDTVVFIDSTQNITVTTADGSNDTFIFEDKKYRDFYTTGTLSGAYTAGDPLIQKDGNDLKIGNITVKDIDGQTNNIQIVDKEGKTKDIIIGQGTITGTYQSEIIVGSNSADVINYNGGNDLIYMGAGNDTLNLVKVDSGVDNSAEMIGIGGTQPIKNNLTIPAISVYDTDGDDTYNTTLKEFGLYIEDYAGNDTLNIKYSDDNLMYLFDVVNPDFKDKKPTIYTDLMICDKSQFMSAGINALSSSTGTGMKAMMESMQGTFGYAWIDDHFGSTQTIENINIIDSNNKSTPLYIDSAIASTQQKIEAWLSHQDKGLFNRFEVSGDFATAWEVIEKGTKADKLYLANLYMNN